MKWLLPLIALSLGLLIGWFVSAPAGADSTDSTLGKQGSTSEIGGGEAKESPDSKNSTQSGIDETRAASADEAWVAGLEGLSQLDQLSALIERMKNSEASDFGSMMDAVTDYSGSMRWAAQGILAAKWATTDPQGMIAYIDAQPADQQWSLRNACYSAWAKVDVNAAYASAASLTGQRAQQSALQSVIQVAAKDDPRRAIEMAHESEVIGHRSDWLMRNIYQTWANDDLESARAAALSLPDGPAKVQALSGALSNWMREAPMDALDWLDSMPADGTIYHSKKEVFRQMLNRDFDTAKAYIESKEDSFERREILENVSFRNLTWGKDFEEIEGMYQWIGEVATGQVYDRKVGDLIRSLVDVDRARAEAFVLNLPAGNSRMGAIGNLAQEIAQSDPAAAIEFALGLGYQDEKQRALSNMSWQLARYGVDAVSPIVAANTDPDVQRQLAPQLVAEWVNYDRSSALAWAESLSDDQARNSAIQSVYKNWLQADPTAAMTYLESSVEEERQYNYVRGGLQEWARQDPKAASAWLEDVPESISDHQREEMYRSVSNAFVKHDPMAASEWIATLEEGPNRDRSVESLVGSISKTDPEAGFIWAATIDNVDARQNTLNRSVQTWIRDDPEAAYRAVRDAGIAESEKTHLFEMIEKAR